MKPIFKFFLTVMPLSVLLWSCNQGDDPQPNNGNNIYGFFETYVTSGLVGPSDTTVVVNVEFFDNSATYHRTLAGGVSFGAEALDIFDSTYVLYDPITNPLFTASNWQVVAGNSIPAFTYTDQSPYPNLNWSFPDSQSMNNDLVIPINSATIPGVDTLSISITFLNSITKTWDGSSPNITFSAAELAGISGPYPTVRIMAGHRNTQTFSGKKFEFTKIRVDGRYFYLN